jgi:hypothetical protein
MQRVKIGIALCLLLSCFLTQAQQKEINDQVWRPFIDSFNSFDTDKFMALHSQEVVRSPRDSKSVLNWEQYDKQQKQGDTRSQADQRKRSIELRFTERIANNEQAIDVGIYKTTNINSKGESRSFYGRFHVVLRKEKGIWKILVDTDSSENGTIDEADFNSALPLE